MVKAGNLITIIPSIALTNMRLNDLVKKTAKIIEIKRSGNGTVLGCWVSLVGDLFQGEQEWYIPYSSISE
jgi:hypothetical protein